MVGWRKIRETTSRPVGRKLELVAVMVRRRGDGLAGGEAPDMMIGMGFVRLVKSRMRERKGNKRQEG